MLPRNIPLLHAHAVKHIHMKQDIPIDRISQQTRIFRHSNNIVHTAHNGFGAIVIKTIEVPSEIMRFFVQSR